MIYHLKDILCPNYGCACLDIFLNLGQNYSDWAIQLILIYGNYLYAFCYSQLTVLLTTKQYESTIKSAKSLIEVKFTKGTAFLVSSQFPCPVPHDAIPRASAECAISSWQRIKLLYKNVKGFASEPLSRT